MRTTSLSVSLVLVAVLVMGCQTGPPEPTEEMGVQRTDQEVESDFDALRADWERLANADDFAGVAALYSPDAVYTDAFGAVHNGPSAIQSALENSAVAAGSNLSIQTTGTVVHGDLIAGYGTFSQTVPGPDGDMAMEGRWQTVALYQADGTLKLRLHQSTIPAPAPSSM